MLRANVALGLGHYFDVGISIPMYGDFINDTKAKDLSGAGIGDPSLSVKAGRALVGNHVFDGAMALSLTLPTKNANGFLPKQFSYIPADSLNESPKYFSSYGVGGTIQTFFTLDLSHLETKPPFRANVNTGFTQSGAAGTAPVFLLGSGIEWMPIPSLEFFANLQTETRSSQISKVDQIGKEFSFAAFGFSASSEDGIFFSAGVQKSLTDRPLHTYAKTIPGGVMTYSTHYQPEFALAVNLGWSGSLVSVDSDHDGIPDKEDQCPNEPEDKDGFQDEDGCPDPDNDKDGIPDLKDKCPNDPEDFDGFEDSDGCPDPDNDHDKIPDVNDKCPNEPETYNGFEDDDGCPDTVDKGANHNQSIEPLLPLDKRTQIRRVQFIDNTARLVPEAYSALDTLVTRIQLSPDMIIEVRGYLDDVGSESERQKLSEARAVSVREYLISKGIGQDRVIARGMGSRDPLTTNHTAAGRKQNRRIEIHRLD